MGEFSIRSVVGSRGSGEGLRSVAEVEPSNDLLTRVTGLAGARVGLGVWSGYRRWASAS